MDWMAHLLHLPPCFLSEGGGTGVIQSTASEATLVGLLAAKARSMHGRPPEDALRLCAYCSDQAHSSGGWVTGVAVLCVLRVPCAAATQAWLPRHLPWSCQLRRVLHHQSQPLSTRSHRPTTTLQ